MSASKFALLIVCICVLAMGQTCIPEDQSSGQNPHKLVSASVATGNTVQLVINEIMQNPSAVSDGDGEWFELYNPTASPVDIDGWIIQDNDIDSHVINNGGPLLVPAGGYLVLGINGDPATNGGVIVDYVYPTNFYLGNSSDELILLTGNLTEVDRVEWDNGATFPDPTGAAMALMDPALDNNIGANWCEASTPFGDGDLGTPGAANDCVSDIPQLVINEIMQNPAAMYDSNGEWFELYNPTASAVDIDGWIIQDNDFDSHVISNGGPLLVPAGGYLVLGINGDPATNGGVIVDYVYPTNFYLGNSSDELILLTGNLTEVDRVEWDNGATFPDPNGAAMALIDPALDNNIGANWCEASTPYGDGDLGTPGAANDCVSYDTTPPEITCPDDLNVECSESTDPSATGSATATDDTDPDPAITHSDDTLTSESCPQESIITRTWTATDESGNSSFCDQVISVVDTTPPVLSDVSEDITVECDAVPEANEVTASDNCDENPTIEFNEERIDGNCPSNYVLERTWTAADACSNEVSAHQTITVQDTTPPVILLIGDENIILECHTGTYQELDAIVSDNCNTEPIEVIIGGDDVDVGTPGEYVVTYDATDACNNDAEQVTRTVTVVDTTPPVVTVGNMIEIWPANHKYHTFSLSELVITVEDACEGLLDVDQVGTILSIYSDEPQDAKGGGDGHTTDDIVILGSSSFKVRAERQGGGNGRVYGITFEVADAAGNVTVATSYVGVPHDKSGAPPVDDGPGAGYTVVP